MAKAAQQATKATFTSILDQPSGEVDRSVKPLPIGSYIARVVGQPKIDLSSQKQTEFSEYTLQIIDLWVNPRTQESDVSEDELEDYLTNSDGSKKRLQDVTIRTQFYHTDAAKGRLLNFLDHLDGIRPGTPESKEVVKSARERMAEVDGKEVVIHIKHQPWLSGQGVSARVDMTAPVE